MTEAILDKIKTLIKDSKSFGILLDNNPEEHELLLKKVLEETIALRNIPVVSLPKEPEEFRKKWSEILREEKKIELPQKTSIKIPKKKYKIKEVSYKEDDENISFIVDLPKNNLSLEDLSLEKLAPQPDTVFCLFENEEGLERFKNNINVPKKDRVVFVRADEKTLTDKVFDILAIFEPDIQNNGEIVTTLFAALAIETNNFSEKTTKETFSLANLLTKNGAKTKIIEKIRENEKKASTAQLVGRILARTYTDETFGISWSFLNNRDLQKTNNISISAVSLYKLLKNVRSFIPQQNLYVLLWQTTDGVKALVIAAKNRSREYLVPFAKKTNAQLQNKFFVVGPFSSFSEAERKLRQSFKEEINNVVKNYVENNSIIG